MKRTAVLLIALLTFATACTGGNVFSLAVGTCFEDPDSLDEVLNVEIVDCAEPHDNETYFVYDVAGDTYPGESAVTSLAQDRCLAEFDAFVNMPYADSALAVSFLTPTTASWDQGDREVVCFLFDLAGARRTGTAKGAGI